MISSYPAFSIDLVVVLDCSLYVCTVNLCLSPVLYFFCYSMEKGKMIEISKDKNTQFRWSKPMSKKLLKLLADEIKKGNRPNIFFKSSSFTAAANTISKNFDVKYLLITLTII